MVIGNALWKSYQQSHLVANQEELGKENYGFCLQNLSFIFTEFLNILKSYNMGPKLYYLSKGRHAADLYRP
jgi:hypothetical protein